MKATKPLRRKTPMLARRGFAARAVVEAARERVTVEFDDKGSVKGVYKTSGLRPGRSTGKPTKAQVRRWDAMRARGCVACHLNGVDHGLARVGFARDLEVHHLLSGGRRLGHDATVCLCHYHHQGKFLPVSGLGYEQHAHRFGPSLEREPRRFREMYGTDDQILAYQGLMLDGAELVGEGVNV